MTHPLDAAIAEAVDAAIRPLLAEMAELVAERIQSLPAVLTVTQVAGLLGVSRDTVYRLLRDGDLWRVELPVERTVIARATVQQLLDRSPTGAVA